MQFELKRLFRGSAIYGVGSFVQRFLLLILLPFFTRSLSPEDYGVIALVGLLSVALVGFFSLGTANSMGLLYFETPEEDRNKVVWSTALLLAANSLFLFLLLCWIAPSLSSFLFYSPQYAGLLVISFATSAITTTIEPFFAHLRYQEKAKQFVLLTLGGALIGTSFSAVFVLRLDWGVQGVLLAALLGQCVLAMLVAFFVAFHLRFGLDRSLFGPLVRIGFPSIFGIFAFLVIDYADRQMLQRMIDLDAVGVYSVGYNLALVMLIAVSAFGMAWPPFFISFIQRRAEAEQLFGRVLLYYLAGFGVLTLLFFSFATPLVAILSPDFRGAAQIIGIVAAAYMLKGAYLIFLPGITFAKKLYLQSGIEWVAAIANLGLNLLLIPRFGIIGAAIATLASYALMVALSWRVSRRFLQVHYDWTRLFIVLAATCTACAWMFWSSTAVTLPWYLTQAVLVNFLLILVLFRHSLTAEERMAIHDQLNRRSRQP